MPGLVWNIALTKAHLGDVDGAMTDAMTYGQYSPTPPQGQLLDEVRRIGAQEAGATSQAAGASPQTDEDARAEFEQGRRAFEAGQYQEALRHFETATEAPGLDPSRMVGLVRNIALSKARLGDVDGAMTAVMTYRSLAAGQEALQLEERVASILAEQSGASEAGERATGPAHARSRRQS